MRDRPLGFHITFGAYGKRLHGDERGTVDRRMNQPGEPIIGRDEAWESYERSLLKFAPVELTLPQRRFIEGKLPAICERGGWTFHIAAAQVDHVHLLITAAGDAEGDAQRRLVKRWLSQEMNTRWPLLPGARWWSKGGSVKWVWTEEYFENVWGYVEKQRVLR